jgi:hypothetical protein
MKKPHEQEWKPTRDSSASRPKVCDADGLCIATVTVHYKIKGRWNVPQHASADVTAALIAAAPDMARALMEVSPIVDGVAHSPLCGTHGLGVPKRCHHTCQIVHDALRKACVL